MKRALISLAAFTALVGSAQATVYDFTLNAGQEIHTDALDLYGNDLEGQVTQNVGGLFAAALGIIKGSGSFAATSGTVLNANATSGRGFELKGALLSVSGRVDDGGDTYWSSLTLDTIATNLGFTVNALANTASEGGMLTISNITLDLRNKGILADVSGSNGVNHEDLLLWSFDSTAGDSNASAQLVCPVSSGFSCSTFVRFRGAPSFQLSGLKLTSQAYDLFGTALSLTDFGSNALKGATLKADGGVFLSVVPEASSLAMGLLGLAGLVAVSRRQAGIRKSRLMP